MVIRGTDAHHISTVLRLPTGTVIRVSGQDGQSAAARIIAAVPETVELELTALLTDTTEPPIDVWLVQGLAKGEKMDFIIQKAVELGAHGIIPIATAHSVVRYDADKQQNKVVRWQKIAREAAKQCGRSHVPEVCPISSLQTIVTDSAFAAAAKIMLYEGQAALGIKEALTLNKRQAYLLFIGPEGGFSTAEVELCQKHGLQIVTMGPRILRTETAALAALTAVLYECGDLEG